MNDPFVLECSGLPPDTRVVAFDGVEEISTTYRYEIDVLVDTDGDLGEAVGASATLAMRSAEQDETVVHGVVESATVVDHDASMDLYKLVLVPRVKDLLGLDRHSRVFVGEAVPSILQTLLREAGLRHEDCDFRLLREYDPIEFVCQYRESTLDFLMRWMERDGIYFFFSHGGDRERLVIADDRRQHGEPRVQAPFVTWVGSMEQDGLHRFRPERRAVPRRVHVDDYDYLRPSLPVRGEAVVEGGRGGELRVRGAKVTTPKEANRIAKLRAEGLRARQTLFYGEGRLPGIHAGELFTLTGHPRASLDGNYLVTRLHVTGHHTGELSKSMKERLGREDEPDDVVRTELVALWSEVQFRPELRTQPPRVYSMESGVIEGDVDSDYAQIDEHGRYLVKFRFDESGGRGSQASARIRMMQPHAGSPEGMHFPLRKGTEVLIAFVGGDPDRPVIAGAVPNALTPAVVHGGNATKNIIHTGGGNRIVMEDTEGSQYVHIGTPHKGSYIHIGSTFNPQYNKVTMTKGTSLSNTDDISTSMTHTDAQTVVDDARITIIGRSQITPDDTQGLEIKRLLSDGFIEPDMGNAVKADLKQIKTDATVVYVADKAASGTTAEVPASGTSVTALTDVKKAGSLQVTLAGLLESAVAAAGVAQIEQTQAAFDAVNQVANQIQTGVNSLVTQLGTVGNDLTTLTQNIETLQRDAQQLQTDASADPNSCDPATVATWNTQLASAMNALTQASVDWFIALWDSVSLSLPVTSGNLTQFQNALSTLGSASQATSQLVSDLTATVTFTQTAVSAAPVSLLAGVPPLPNPNAGPVYIKLPHVDSSGNLQITPDIDPSKPQLTIDQSGPLPPNVTGATLNTSGVVPETSDPTAIDTGSGGALHPGSDVKIVGGDNVTLVAKDVRSETGNHAFSLVHNGQTSVVRGGVQSSIYSQSNATKMADAPAPSSGDAQQTVIWGDTTSSLHGSQTSHIGDSWGNTHSTVIMGSRSVAMTGPVDVYNFAGLAKESAVLAPAIVDVKIGSMVNFKWAIGSINVHFNSLWNYENDGHTLHAKEDLSTTIANQVGPMIRTALAPIIDQGVLHLKDDMAAIHTTQVHLHDAISAIHTYNIHIHLGFTIFGPP